MPAKLKNVFSEKYSIFQSFMLYLRCMLVHTYSRKYLFYNMFAFGHYRERFERVNMSIADVISLLCGVALFLFGMLLMGDGLKSVAGSKLEVVLYRLTSTPLKGVLLGTGITAVIQSSSATSIMVVGFVNSGMMKVRQAIGIVLGAILGTSITGWIISLSGIGGDAASWLQLVSTSTLTGIVAIVGIIFRMFCKKRVKQHIGDILMGFAVLMTGMSAMSESVAGLRDSEVFVNILTSLSNPVLGILAGTAITCVLQSASATIGILQAMSMTGAVSFEVAFPIIMGIAIGAAVPVLLSALGTNVAGKRTAFVYLIIDVIGAVFWASVFYSINAFAHFDFMTHKMSMVDIALMNTLFRFATVLLLAPFIKQLEKLVCCIFKENPEDAEETAEIDRLEERFISHPSIAIEQSNDAVCSMARKARKNLARAFELMYSYSDEKFKVIQNKEEVIDRYEDKLGTYLVKLTGQEMTAEQGRVISKILHTIGDFERIGDHAINFSMLAREMDEKHIKFTPSAQKELDTITSAVSEVVVLATDAFVENDMELAGRVEPLEEVIDSLCDEMKIRHVRRIQSGECTLDHGFVFNDLLNNFERIADHCSNIAVAMIELQKDVFDTHEYLNQVKSSSIESFKRYYDEYSREYHI